MSTSSHLFQGLGVSLLRAGLLVLIVCCLTATNSTPAQTLEDFGYKRMTVQGTPASGARPLAVVLMSYAGSPDFLNGKAYYDDLIFNPFKTSLNGYFLENSQGRFHWSKAGAGIYGPFYYAASDYGVDADDGFTRLYLALQTLAGAGFDFTQYDANHDGEVTPNELSVLAIDNKLTEGGVNRATKPNTFDYTNPSGVHVAVTLSVATFGQRSSFSAMTHEVSHQLGTIEMYGSNGAGANAGYTLMGPSKGLDDMQTFHLDPWHKMLLGWVEPRIFSVDTPGSTTINAAQYANGQSPVILYSPAKGYLEFYMLEFRTNTRTGGGKYDANVGWDGALRAGLVLWHIKTKGIGGDNVNGDVDVIDAYDVPGAQIITVFTLGSPSFIPGRGDVWRPMWPVGTGVVPYELKWLNGFGPTTKVKVQSITNAGDLLHVSWGNFIEVPPIPTEKFLFYNNANLSATTGAINPTDLSYTSLQPDLGDFSYWTHVVGDGVDVLFYDAKTGGAAIGQVDGKGKFTTTLDRRPTYFIPGWTHVVRHKGYYLFYNSNTGAAVAGNFGSPEFQPYNSWKDFSTGWTHIVSTENGLLFYNATSGAGFVGEWSVVRSGPGGDFGQISKVNLNRSWSGSFTAGWTNIVDTPSGLLFYRAEDGMTEVADVDKDGSVTSRLGTRRTIAANWTSVTSDKTHVLFYNASSGDVAVGGIRTIKVGEVSATTPGAPLAIEIHRVFPGLFSPGWTHVVSTMDPPQL